MGLSDYCRVMLILRICLSGQVISIILLSCQVVQPIMNSTEMLGSPKMCTLVKELKERYPKRIIIFDLPPVLNTADTLSFVPCVDCALIVVEDDVTKEMS